MTSKQSTPQSRRGGITLEPLVMRLLSVLWLAVVWSALWGDAAPGTFVAGLIVGTIAMWLVTGRSYTGAARVRPLRALLYAGVFLLMLVESTVDVLLKVLAPRLKLNPAVIDVALPPAPPAVATLVANSVTLTPGTLSLNLEVADDDSAVLQIHALDAPDPEAVRADALRLHALALAAFDRPDSHNVATVRRD